MLEQVQDRTSAILARRYREMFPEGDPAARISRFVSILEEEGFVMECVIEGDRAVLSKRNCPFVGIQTFGGDFCKMHRQIISLALGLPVVSVDSRRQGDACCRFEIHLKS